MLLKLLQEGLSTREGILHPGLRKLLAATLVRALRDLKHERRDVRLSAVLYLFAPEVESCFDAPVVCELLDLDIEALRDFCLQNFPSARQITGYSPRTRAVSLKELNYSVLAVLEEEEEENEQGERH
jgi:hypothetical protein